MRFETPWWQRTLNFVPTPAFVALAGVARVLVPRVPRARAVLAGHLMVVLQDTPDRDRVAELVGRYAHELVLLNADRYRPRRVLSTKLVGQEHLEAARARGRGVIITLLHQGPWFAIAPALSHAGVAFSATITPEVLDPAPKGMARFGHMEMLTNSRYCDSAEELVITRRGSMAALRERLLAGQMLTLNFDVGGSLRTEMLGRPVGLAVGTAKLALETGAAVVPMSMRRTRAGLEARAYPAIDLSGAEDLDSVQTRLARAHERAVLARPWSIDRPRARFSPLRT